jgi:hypothetical protein
MNIQDIKLKVYYKNDYSGRVKTGSEWIEIYNWFDLDNLGVEGIRDIKFELFSLTEVKEKTWIIH